MNNGQNKGLAMVQAQLPARKTIALVAHDHKKPDLLEWSKKHKSQLSTHTLCGTGTTGRLLEEALNLPVKQFLSGPLGGDQQLGGKIAEGDIHCLIFFWDPFQPMPHDPDVKALLRLATAWNIPVACNIATADLLLNSEGFNRTLERPIPDYAQYMQNR